MFKSLFTYEGPTSFIGQVLDRFCFYEKDINKVTFSWRPFNWDEGKPTDSIVQEYIPDKWTHFGRVAQHVISEPLYHVVANNAFICRWKMDIDTNFGLATIFATDTHDYMMGSLDLASSKVKGKVAELKVSAFEELFSVEYDENIFKSNFKEDLKIMDMYANEKLSPVLKSSVVKNLTIPGNNTSRGMPRRVHWFSGDAYAEVHTPRRILPIICLTSSFGINGTSIKNTSMKVIKTWPAKPGI